MSAPSIAASGTTEALLARARRSLPGGANSGARRFAGAEDLAIVAAGGATFTDAGGRTFVDYHAAYGPLILGHADAEILAAFTEAVRTVDLTGFGVTPYEIELAEKIQQHVPSAERVVLLAHGDGGDVLRGQARTRGHGAQAAREVPGLLPRRPRLGRAERDLRRRPARREGPLSAGILPEVIDATLILPFNDLEAVQRAASEHRGEIAAIILEPIPHNIGAVLPEPSFLQGLRTICDREGIVLVFDEVITGFRHGLAATRGSPASRRISPRSARRWRTASRSRRSRAALTCSRSSRPSPAAR